MASPPDDIIYRFGQLEGRFAILERQYQSLNDLHEALGLIKGQLLALGQAQQSYVTALAETRTAFDTSLKRLHEDVCGSLRGVERMVVQQSDTIREQAAILRDQEEETAKMVQHAASVSGGIKVVVALLPLLYGLVTGALLYWFFGKR